LSTSLISSVHTVKVISSMDLDLDKATQSNYYEIFTERVDIDWKVDFDTQTISGSIDHTLSVKKDDVRELMFVILLYPPCLVHD
jgi:hypothetical protein